MYLDTRQEAIRNEKFLRTVLHVVFTRAGGELQFNIEDIMNLPVEAVHSS